MAAYELPEDITRFIQQHIHSILQLEILLLLREHGADFSPSKVANDLRITEESATLLLRDLQLRGLVREVSASDSYRYDPESEELARLVSGLSDAYRDLRYTVINLIFSVPGDSARLMADSFRIRKRKDE